MTYQADSTAALVETYVRALDAYTDEWVKAPQIQDRATCAEFRTQAHAAAADLERQAPEALVRLLTLEHMFD